MHTPRAIERGEMPLQPLTPMIKIVRRRDGGVQRAKFNLARRKQTELACANWRGWLPISFPPH